ncbi:membrane protein [Gemmatimonadetes bacterium T265]|nr:membrane protein [Gemmatimonadetes bacterium T265]
MASVSQPLPRAAASRPRAGRVADARAEFTPYEPRRAGWLATLVFAAASLLLGAPALVGKFLVNPHSDQYIAGYAFREFAAASLKQGAGFPLWNPYLFGGMPYVAAMHGDEFYPPSLVLRFLLPTDAAMTWGFILHVFLAGAFTYAFLRGALRLSFFPALIGGLAYMLGGNVAGLVSPGHDGKLYLAALLPLVLLLVHRLVVNGRAWAAGALGLAITFAVLTPHPQLLQYLLLLAGAYGLFAAFGRTDSDDARLQRGTAVRRLAAAAGAVVLGFLGSAVQYWPVFEYTPWSPRAGGKGYEHAISYSMPPEELINTYVPEFSGILDHYTGRNQIHLHSEYIGAAVLVLATIAFASRGYLRRQLWFWIGAFAIATLWALGGYTPFFQLIYALVPGTKFFRAPSTMLYIVSFCTALFAALGAQVALSRPIARRYMIPWSAVGVGVALLATSGALSNLAADFVFRPEYAPLVDENKTALTLGAWRALLMVGFATAGLLIAATGRVRQAGIVLSATVALDLWSVGRRYWQFSPPAAQLFASDPVIEYLQRVPQPGRVAPLATGDQVASDPYFGGGDGRADGLMVHRIRSVAGYHGNELGRYLSFSGWPESDNPGDWPHQVANPNFARLSNLQFIYSNASQPPIPGMQLVAGPARNVGGNMVYLYRFPEDNPLAWVTPIAVKAPDDNVLATVLDPRFDVRRAALFDTAAQVSAQPVPGQLPAPLNLTTRVTRYAPGQIDLVLSAPAPAGASLVVSENYYPGWTATVDGRPAAVGRADYVLTGVSLPAGARNVSLRFTSPRFQTGLLVSAAAVALSFAAFGAGLVVQRRRGPSPS